MLIDGNEPKLKVRLRGGFSDRNGIKKENTQIQYENFDERTRISFVNLINIAYNRIYAKGLESKKQFFLKKVLSNVYVQKVDFSEQCLYDEESVFDTINDTLLLDNYDCVLSLIEFLCKEFAKSSYEEIYAIFNSLFEKEYVGYRFVDNIILRITDKNEVKSIESSSDTEYSVVNEHMEKAVALLADRKNPDYENSIKESISAVEAICEYLTGIRGKEASLGKMLKKIEESGVVIHSAMKSAFNILYGYTSDANGIRHAGNIGGPSSTFEEAKFMLVSCSAFINYLIGVSAN